VRILRVNYKGVEPSARFDDSASQEAVSGQIDTIRVIFTFSNEWKQYEKITAVFAGNGQSAGIILDDTMECFVPPFATKKAGYFLVGCFANSKTDKGLVRYPGRNATVKTTTGASVSAVHPDEETVTAYEQLLDRLVLSEENLHEATENANTAANGANYAASNANSAAARANSAISNAQVAADRANKAAERAENIAPGGEGNSGKLLYVDNAGNVAHLQLGTGLEIVNGRLCIIGTVTPDEPDNPDEPTGAISFAQTDENTVTVSGVVFEQQADGTVLWRGATFTPGEENSVVIK
jgi:hypothetical protein